MASKLNNNAVLAYAESFAKAVCSDFFAKHERITGSQLTDFCGIKQVNLFIIKILFEKWQEDNAKIKSPFFDYENPEIKALLEKLMNMLSRNISIDEATFQTLVTQSVADTIQLLLAPYVFYEQEIQKLAQNGNSTLRINEEFKPALKYVKTHKVLFEQIVKGLEEQSNKGMISATKAIDVIGDIVDNNVEYDDPKTILRQLGEIVPLKVQEFVTFTDQEQKTEKVEEKAPKVEIKEVPQKQENKSFFETSFEEEETEEVTSVVTPKVRQVEKKEETKVEEKQEKSPLFTSYRREEVEEKREDNSSFSTFEKEEKIGSPLVATSVAPKQAEVKEIKTFADKFTTGADDDRPTFAERFKPSGKTIKELITLNQKFLFTKKLFGNNQDELEDALTGIDRCATHKEAIMFLKNNYIIKYDWNFQNDEVKEFWELVELRF